MAEPSFDIAEARRGQSASACPGLFRIVPARDGGICRVKIPLGSLPASRARAVAAAAVRHGSGIIEATNRANLQLRGVRPESENALIAELLAAGLGPPRPDADDIRNVMVSPTAGIDPAAVMDVLPLARDLLARLQTDAACRALSPKFCFLVDGGEAVAVVDHPHDLWLASMAEGRLMALGFAGGPPTRPQERASFVAVRPRHALAAVAAAVAIFQEEAAPDPTITRLRHLLARLPAAAFLERLSERLGAALHHGAEVLSWRRRAPGLLGHIGIGRQRQEGLAFVGAQPPLGRLTPETLRSLADIAEESGDGSIRLTPWQSVMLANVPQDRAKLVAAKLAALGLVSDRNHPLAAMVACSGTPGCSASHADTKADASHLAQRLAAAGAPARSVHLSGCSKSCASARVADVTLVASAPGRYELFRKAEGEGGKFGISLGRDLAVADAGALLSEAKGPR